jgi:hypothetical protein
MTCQKHEIALLLTAANNSELPRNLALHLEHCPVCSATLCAQKALFLRIDHTLRDQMNDTPSPTFFSQLRLKLANAPPARTGTHPARLQVAGAALALALTAMLYGLVHARQSSVPPNLQITAMRTLPNTATTQSVRGSEALRVTPVPQQTRPAARKTKSHGPEVLVPKDEQKAFSQYVARLAARDIMAEAVVRPVTGNTIVERDEFPDSTSVDIAALQFNRAEQNQWMSRNTKSNDEEEE